MSDAVTTFTWASFGAAMAQVVIGSAVGSGLTLFATSKWRDRDVEQSASSLAVQLADIFDRFALGCAEVRGHHSNNPREDPWDWASLASLPTLGELPANDAQWQALDRRFEITARTFGQRIDRASGLIRWEADHGDADDVAMQLERQAKELGVAAMEFARDLRETYELGDHEYGWDIATHFEAEKRRIEEADIASEEWSRDQREMMEEVIAASKSEGAADAAPSIGRNPLFERCVDTRLPPLSGRTEMRQHVGRQSDRDFPPRQHAPACLAPNVASLFVYLSPALEDSCWIKPLQEKPVRLRYCFADRPACSFQSTSRLSTAAVASATS